MTPRASIDATRPGLIECEACDDTGWERLECTGDNCGRPSGHAPHTYVVACACRVVNATYQRKIASRVRGEA